MDRLSLFIIFFVDFFLNRSSTATSVGVYYARHLLDTCLNTSRHLYLSRFTNFYIKVQRDPFLTFLDLSLDRLIFSPPQTSLTHSKLIPQGFFKLLQVFLHLVSFESLIFMHFMFWNLGFGVFEKKFGVFENCWVFVEILGWVVA